MTLARNTASRREIQQEVQSFLESLRHPVLDEAGLELLDLTTCRWQLTIDFGKLLFEAWSSDRSIVRRLEDVTYRDHDCMRLLARKPGGGEPTVLELRESGPPSAAAGLAEKHRDVTPAERAAERARFRGELQSLLERQFPGWRLERVSHRSDREHSFSSWYTRGLARRGPVAWAFLGLDRNEAPAAGDAALAHALIWLDWLRGRSDKITVSGLKLFLSAEAIAVTAHRATCLNPRAVQIEIFEWMPGRTESRPVDLSDFGNVETRLTARRNAESLLARHQGFLRQLLKENFGRLDVVADASASTLSLRVLGLEVARVEGESSPRVRFGLEDGGRQLDEENRHEFTTLLKRVVQLRTAASKNPSHEIYRLQSERWLESLLVRDVTRIDPSLSPDHVYPQVPAFSGMDRGVIDILGVTRGTSPFAVGNRAGAANRLAVIELKVHEEINLPLQGLDYWIRVKWLHERGQFREFGYFPDMELGAAPPLLYLVSPAFRFHSTTDRIVRYLDPAIEVIKVGLNQQWREGPKVLFRSVAATRGNHEPVVFIEARQ